MNINKVTIAGNLTRDPELRHTPNGNAICQFGVAVNRKWKDANGQQKEEVYFADCQAWGKTAEVIAQYCKKGSSLYVEGRLKREEWEDKNGGGKKSATRIVVESFQFVGVKKEEGLIPRGTNPNPPADKDSDVPF